MCPRRFTMMILTFAVVLTAQTGSPSKLRPIATYSIVARDPDTGQMGVAVQSHWFSVGSAVTWAQAGVGAVATQSFTLMDYGPDGLELMAGGIPAPAALSQLVQQDDGRAVRQVGMIDAGGRVASHTGSQAIFAAGHHVGDNYAVQANLMETDQVWPEMAAAYEASKGDLAERMMVALEAAQAVGGDIRGRQSAAMLIVSGEKPAKPWQGVELELRVEDHPDPLKELRRLIRVHQAYAHMNAGDLAVEHANFEQALEEYGAAMEMFPRNLEMKFWTAVSMVNMGHEKDAYKLFRQVFKGNIKWRTLLMRLPDSGLVDEKKVTAVLKKTR